MPIDIWNKWSLPNLQSEISPDRLTFISEVLKNIGQERKALYFYSDKKSLGLIYENLLPSSHFTKLENIKLFVRRFDDMELRKLAKKCNYEPVEEKSSELYINNLSKLIVQNKNYLSHFIEMLDFSSRFINKGLKKQPGQFMQSFPSRQHPIELTHPYKTLKDYQQDCIDSLTNALEPPNSRSILQMPTGSGKTRTAFEYISRHINSVDNAKVIWLANTRELCEQSVQCFIEVWEHIGQKEVTVSRHWGEYERNLPILDIKSEQLIVAGFHSMWAKLNNSPEDFDKNFSDTTLLVIDEAHVAIAKTYRKVIDQISLISWSRMLGLTATPGRTIQAENPYLAELFHDEIVSLKDKNKERSNPIAFLREKGVMSKTKYDVIPYKNHEQGVISNNNDFSEKFLKKVGADPIRTAEVIKLLTPYLEQNKKIILFAPSVENSFLLASILRYIGFNSIHIDGNVPTDARDTMIDDFKKGRAQVLCNYGVLATGFDDPRVDLVCISRPTLSPVLYSQMIGRGLRGPAVGGTDTCVILEVRDNFENMSTQDGLYKFFENYWR